MLVRLAYGARVSIIVGAVSTLAAVGLGTAIGLAAGFLGGWVDRVLSWLIDTTLSLPFLLFAISLVVARRPRSDDHGGRHHPVLVVPDRPRRARPGARHARARVHRGGPVARCEPPADHGGRRAAQPRRAARRLRHAARPAGDRVRGDAVIPRPRRRAADGDLGRRCSPRAPSSTGWPGGWSWSRRLAVLAITLALNLLGDACSDAFDVRAPARTGGGGVERDRALPAPAASCRACSRCSSSAWSCSSSSTWRPTTRRARSPARRRRSTWSSRSSARLGLDQPMPTRFGRFLGDVAPRRPRLLLLQPAAGARHHPRPPAGHRVARHRLGGAVGSWSGSRSVSRRRATRAAGATGSARCSCSPGSAAHLRRRPGAALPVVLPADPARRRAGSRPAATCR